MSKTKQNIAKSRRGDGAEFWSRRPLSGFNLCAENKKLCRRIERRRKWLEIMREFSWWGMA